MAHEIARGLEYCLGIRESLIFMPKGSNPNSRNNLRLFTSGMTGNPAGRPKGLVRVEEMAREKTERAIEVLSAIMEDNDAPTASRVTAASVLLDRGWGRPRADVTITEQVDVSSLSDDDLDTRIADEMKLFLAAVEAVDTERAEQVN